MQEFVEICLRLLQVLLKNVKSEENSRWQDQRSGSFVVSTGDKAWKECKKRANLRFADNATGICSGIFFVICG